MIAQKEVVAGPYELSSKKDKQERITLCIVDGNEVSTRRYKGAKLVSSSTDFADDFDKAMGLIESKIASFKTEYNVKEHDVVNGPGAPVLVKKSSTPAKTLLVKRAAA